MNSTSIQAQIREQLAEHGRLPDDFALSIKDPADKTVLLRDIPDEPTLDGFGRLVSLMVLERLFETLGQQPDETPTHAVCLSLLEFTLLEYPPEIIRRSALNFVQSALHDSDLQLEGMSQWAVDTILTTRSPKLLQTALLLLEVLDLTTDQELRRMFAPILLALACHEAFTPFCLAIMSDWPPEEQNLHLLVDTARTKAFAFATILFDHLDTTVQNRILATRISDDGPLVAFASILYRLCELERRLDAGLDPELLDSFACLAVNLERQQDDDEDNISVEEREAFVAALVRQITAYPDRFSRYDLLQKLGDKMEDEQTLDLIQTYLTPKRCRARVLRELAGDNPGYIPLAVELGIPVSETILRLWEKDFQEYVNLAGHLVREKGGDWTMEQVRQFVDFTTVTGPPEEAGDLSPRQEDANAWKMHYLMDAFRDDAVAGLPLLEACLQSPHAHIRIEAAELFFSLNLQEEEKALEPYREHLDACRQQLEYLVQHPAITSLERMHLLQILIRLP
ncbi:MAG: hypothetical protein QM296_01050 [Bacillota bacterium]|nr:hypothetical protein [Bacillota bacterium]